VDLKALSRRIAALEAVGEVIDTWVSSERTAVRFPVKRTSLIVGSWLQTRPLLAKFEPQV